MLALRFLGHFVGDLHQPLHVGFAEDAGGNTINVHWNTGMGMVNHKLHAVWDSDILNRAGHHDRWRGHHAERGDYAGRARDLANL